MPFRFDTAVCIGRFQLLHDGQLALIRQALVAAPRVLIILGSAHATRSPRNPFTWQERADTIRQAVSPEEASRLQFVPMRDLYDMQRWASAVRAAVAAQGGEGARIALVGHSKDDSSAYLREFPGWTLLDPGRQGDIHARALRARLFGSASLPEALASIEPQVPEATLEFLRAWSKLPHYEYLRAEWQAITSELAKWEGAPYPPVFVTVDVVLRSADHLLLIRRGRAPGKGRLAVPGGFLEQRETILHSAVRELEEETMLKISSSEVQQALRSARVFDHPDRSQRGRVITHAHYFILEGMQLPEVEGADDAAEARWVRIADLASMEDQFHDDHFHILDTFLHLIDPPEQESPGVRP